MKSTNRWSCVLALTIGLLVPSVASAQTMDDLFLEWIGNGVNVVYALDEGQTQEMNALIDEIDAQAGTDLSSAGTVILYYIDLWNVRNASGLLGSGRAQWLAFLAPARKPGGNEILLLRVITNNAALAAYVESRGLTGVVTVAEKMDVRWLMEDDGVQATRSMRLRVAGDMGRITVNVDAMPLTTSTGVDFLNGIDFLVRPPMHPTLAIGLENSVQQFAANLATVAHEINLAGLNLPFTSGNRSSNVNRFFPGNGGVTTLRTETRFWRWWMQ